MSAEVHVWRVELETVEWPALAECLDAEERERAARFLRERDRVRYVASHAALRRILAACLGVEPRALHFDRGKHGKPFLPGCELRFNLSHSGAMALCAVAHGRDVGVDLEEVRPRAGLLEIADRFFTAEERSLVSGAEDFYRVWTRKEALLKAAGVGVAGLEQAPDTSPWQVWDLAPHAGYAGAVAADARGGEAELKVLDFRYNPGADSPRH